MSSETDRSNYAGLRRCVEHRRLADLKPNPRRARRHSKKKISNLADCLRRYGPAGAIVVDEDDVIIGGHALFDAAKKAGISEFPTIRVDDLSPADKRALALALNRWAEMASWDDATLREELQFLNDLDFSLSELGFETDFVDKLFGMSGCGEDDPVEPPDALTPPVSRLGDIWLLGDHRLLCGDAREAVSYERLMAGELAQMVITDPPYNVRIQGNVSGAGKKVHGDFQMASGELTQDQYTDLLRSAFTHLVQFSADGSIHQVFNDWRHMKEMINAAEDVYTEVKNLCVWAKNNAGLGSFYRSQHELVFIFKSGSGDHVNNFGLGGSGRHRSNLWSYAGANGFGKERQDSLELHPTTKPIQMIQDALLDCSHRRGIILDPFAGSGTIFLAAERTGRRAFAMELDPLYVDVSLRRYRRETGKEPLLESGETLDEIEAERLPGREAA